MKKFIAIVLCLFLVVSFAACSSEEEVQKEFKIGDVINVDGVEYTVTKVTTSKGDGFFEPDKGNEFVVVTIKIENKSEDKVSYNALDYTMVNSQGQESDSEWMSIGDKDLGSGELVAGGSISGTVTFQQPKGDKGLKLNYYENVLIDDEYTFQVDLAQ